MIKLKANNVEDLKVIASLVQDAILPIGDFAYFKADQKIMFALNRYCWENESEKSRGNSLLTILNVDSIHIKNIDLTDRTQSLYLLDLSEEDGALVVSFADNKMMKIQADSLSVSLVDTGEIWSVDKTPSH
jgi:hypothetical protein